MLSRAFQRLWRSNIVDRIGALREGRGDNKKQLRLPGRNTLLLAAPVARAPAAMLDAGLGAAVRHRVAERDAQLRQPAVAAEAADDDGRLLSKSRGATVAVVVVAIRCVATTAVEKVVGFAVVAGGVVGATAKNGGWEEAEIDVVRAKAFENDTRKTMGAGDVRRGSRRK